MRTGRSSPSSPEAPAEGAETVHLLTDEPWGVRRSSVRDPDGHGVDVLGHR